MVINILLCAAYSWLLGGIAHMLLGKDGNGFHMAFIGFLGFALSATVRSIPALASIGFGWVLLSDAVGAVVVELIMRRLKKTYYEHKAEREMSTEYEGDD